MADPAAQALNLIPAIFGQMYQTGLMQDLTTYEKNCANLQQILSSNNPTSPIRALNDSELAQPGVWRRLRNDVTNFLQSGVSQNIVSALFSSLDEGETIQQRIAQFATMGFGNSNSQSRIAKATYSVILALLSASTKFSINLVRRDDPVFEEQYEKITTDLSVLICKFNDIDRAILSSAIPQMTADSRRDLVKYRTILHQFSQRIDVNNFIMSFAVEKHGKSKEIYEAIELYIDSLNCAILSLAQCGASIPVNVAWMIEKICIHTQIFERHHRSLPHGQKNQN